ncbi:hypothetical protein PLICRDRAFT_123547, partial [Plicaturopsis crispa FD-325 SS-3]
MPNEPTQNPKPNLFKRFRNRLKSKMGRRSPSSADNPTTASVSTSVPSAPSFASTDVHATQSNAAAASASEQVAAAPGGLPAGTEDPGPLEAVPQLISTPPPALVTDTSAIAVLPSLPTSVTPAAGTSTPAPSVLPAGTGGSDSRGNAITAMAPHATAASPVAGDPPPAVGIPVHVTSEPKRLISKQIAENTVFQSAKTAISLLKGVLDDVHVPAVKSVISGVDSIIQILQKADQNSEDFEVFEVVTSELAKVLDECKESLPEPLGSQMDVLAKQVKTAQEALQTKLARGRFLRVVSGSDDAIEIIQMFRNIAAKIQTFSIACNLQIVKQIGWLNSNAILDKLPRVEAASFQSGNRSECLPGTRKELLADIVSWATCHDNQKIYWLTGVAGIGKTTIAQSAAQMFHDRGILGASFFCGHGHQGRNDVNCIFPTIAYSLAKAHPAFAAGIIKALDKEPDVGHHSILQ